MAEGRCHLFANRIAEAKVSFDRALDINPRVVIQKELGWLNLEAGNHSRAISLLTDHIERNAADFEAYNPSVRPRCSRSRQRRMRAWLSFPLS